MRGELQRVDLENTWTENYDVNTLTVMAVNPFTLFAYWEYGDMFIHAIEAHFETQWSALTHVLRVADVTAVWYDGANAVSCFDVKVQPNASRWYLNGVEPYRDYVIDFGIGADGGQFFSLLRSNCVKTPYAQTTNCGRPLARFRTPLVPIEQSAPPPMWSDQFDGYSLCEGGRAGCQPDFSLSHSTPISHTSGILSASKR